MARRSGTLPLITASAVGEYLYCARAWGLRRAIDDAPDPIAAARAAQGTPLGWRPDRHRWLARQSQRATWLERGTLAHAAHDRRARLARGLALVGALCVAAALVGLLSAAGVPTG